MPKEKGQDKLFICTSLLSYQRKIDQNVNGIKKTLLVCKILDLKVLLLTTR